MKCKLQDLSPEFYGAPTFEIQGFQLYQTCYGCPEQYDVAWHSKQVGYIRLRWGSLRVDFPDCGGEPVYNFGWHQEYKGEFEDDTERMYHLTKAVEGIKDAMIEWINIARDEKCV